MYIWLAKNVSAQKLQTAEDEQAAKRETKLWFRRWASVFFFLTANEEVERSLPLSSI